MTDAEGVPQEQAPKPQEQVPKPEIPKTPEPAGAQPLTAEQLQQLITQAVTRAVDEGKQLGRRELQSAQDRNKAEATRSRTRAETAEGALREARSRLETSDPDAARELELAELRARDQQRGVEEQEEQAKQVQEEFLKNFYTQLDQHITALGIDPKDKRIDWGDADKMPPLEIQQRVLASTAEIQKQNQQVMQTGFEQRLKALEAKTSQANIEANSVSTEASGGAAASPDTEFLKQFGAGTIPMTKANVDRYNKIVQSY